MQTKKNNKKMVTLTNKCSLKVDQSIMNVLQAFLKYLNRKNGTQYSLNDLKDIEIGEKSLLFGFGSNCLEIPIDLKYT